MRLYFRGDAAFASPEIYEYLGRGLRHPPQSERDSPAEHCPCLRDLSVARPTMFAVSTPASAIRPDRGTRSAVSWPKWSGTPASWFLASVSSSLICRALPSGWWRSIITWHGGAAHQGRRSHQLDPSACRKFRNNAVRLQLHALYNLGHAFGARDACATSW